MAKPFLLGKYLEIEWLSHLVEVYLIFWGAPKLLAEVVISFYIFTRSGVVYFYILTNISFGEAFLILVILTGV
jgi:hypothetical protein